MTYIDEKTAFNLMDALANFYGDAYKDRFNYAQMQENMESFARITFEHLCEILGVESVQVSDDMEF